MTTAPDKARLHPHLVVRDASRALEFYAKAFDAKVTERFPGPDGKLAYAAFTFGETTVSLTEENRDWKNAAPPSLGGSPVILNLDVADARAFGNRMLKAGAEVVYPIEDQFYGKREGRLRDPFGHLWIVSQHLP